MRGWLEFEGRDQLHIHQPAHLCRSVAAEIEIVLKRHADQIENRVAKLSRSAR